MARPDLEWLAVVVGSAAHRDPRLTLQKAVYQASSTATSVRRAMRGGRHRAIVQPEAIRTFSDHALYYATKDR
jgi:hypothetical protein